MGIEIRITGDDVSEVAKQLFSLGFILVGKATAAKDDVSQVEEKVERVDNVAAPAESVADTVVVVEEVEEAAPQGAEAEPEADGGVVEDDKVVEVDPEPIEDDEPAMSVDDLRRYTLRNYLLKYFKDLAEQKSAWESLMAEFGVKKLTELSEDKVKAFKLRVDQKIAEVEG